MTTTYPSPDMLARLSLAAEEMELRKQQRAPPDEADIEAWLQILFPTYVSGSFAPHHSELWEWVTALKVGIRPHPFVAIWPRGGAKSTSAELACCTVAARGTRRYALYVSETQDRADDHVQNVAAMLEEESFTAAYPEAGARALSRYGHSKGWRRNRIRTMSGFTVDAIGLDVAARGLKIEADRPDLFILDDLDNEQDSLAIIEKKLRTLTHAILAAGSSDAATLAVQNKVHAQSIFARLADGRADFLNDRIVSGPHPALKNAVAEERNGRYVIIQGEPTWDAMDLARCQQIMDDIGFTAFMVELQHKVSERKGGMYDHIKFAHCTWDDVPDLVRIVAWVDPAVTDTDQSDSQGIQVDGIAADGKIYRLYSYENRTSPQNAIEHALRKAVELGADTLGVETDQGGDTWRTVYEKAVERLEVLQPPVFAAAKAGAGHGSKAHRSSFMLADYERGNIIHVYGTHEILEDALKRFPKFKPYDLVDAAYWAWYDVRRGSFGLPDQVASPGRMGRRRNQQQYPEDEWSGGSGNGSRLSGRPLRSGRRR
ncbi:hypothetical protein LCGC14_0529390 [marine sediment metagenome]|uniref:Terminase large subunit gp17-like C-terminal domain-containing protein n=1 Tax=marine sediment metagenome TaxID=412755 RepID=A0A0F9RWB7_9ZZZZ